MKKPLLIFGIAFLIFRSILSAQTGDDGWNNRIIPSYVNQTETARVSVTLIPEFFTSGQPFHAFIDPNLPFQGGIVVNDGDFDQNYIRAYKPKADNATINIPLHTILDYSKWFESISYYDGLGRLCQTAEVKAMPLGSDLVVPVKYNDIGRQDYKYLPYCIIQDGPDGAGGYRNNDLTEQLTFNNYFYKNEGNYAKTHIDFESSPLDRITMTTGPGAGWQTTGHEKPSEIFYETNLASEIGLFMVNSNNDLVKTNYYQPGKLYKTRQLDENGNETIEYKDLLGNVVSRASKMDGSYATTNYVYDDFGLLRYVIPPVASDKVSASTGTYTLQTDWVKDYCYYYEYNDARKRMTMKKLPGCEPIYMVYNKRDMLVLTQDGNQRPGNKWSFVKYDNFNRAVISGIYTSADKLDQPHMQALVDQNINYYEQFSTTDPDPFYTTYAFPQDRFEIQTVTYYDKYSFLEAGGIAAEYAFLASEMDFPTGNSDATKGMVTGTRIIVQEHDGLAVDDNSLLSVNYYDKYGRLIQTIADNHLGGKNIISNKYNFTGQLLKTKENHINSSSSLAVNQRMEYENGGRLTNTYYKIGDNPEITMSQNVYNELGQVKQKKLHANEGTFLQTEDFQFNIRGWLEKINDVNNPGNDLFAMSLNYTGGNKPQYNGNISEIAWVSQNFPGQKSYSYTYDALNRLKNASFSLSGNYNEELTYDKNGNIITLKRNGQIADGVYDGIDNLIYMYTGNQLKNVNDKTGPAYENFGFKDNGSFAENEYLYDANGNLVKDLNKQIENITYTPQNLPQRITMVKAGQPQILYVYDATGRKLLKQTRLNQAIVSRTDYDGSFVYIDGTLSYILTPEGRALPEGNSFKYEYNLKDHLGNTRVVFDQDGTVLQDNSYYPFGMKFEGLSYENTATSSLNKYLYNGKEMQDDFGLEWYDYGARFYDPVLGRFHTPDRFSEKYLNQSQYQYGLNNPLKFIDINGDSAWQITRQWDDKMIGKYRNYVNGKVQEYTKNGEEFTCEDLVISTMIDFASANGLPFAMGNGSGTYDAASENYSDVATFKNDVLKTTGANDLQSNANSSAIDLRSAQSGDFLLKRDGNNVATHSQLVTSTGNNAIGISQGNSGLLNSIPGSSRILHAGDPNSSFYTGQKVQSGNYNLSTGTYTRQGSVTVPSNFGYFYSTPVTINNTVRVVNAVQSFNLVSRSWNFKSWNK